MSVNIIFKNIIKALRYYIIYKLAFSHSFSEQQGYLHISLVLCCSTPLITMGSSVGRAQKKWKLVESFTQQLYFLLGEPGVVSSSLTPSTILN